MCTSLTYTNSHGGHFLARTMDFNVDFETRIMFMPRHYRVTGDLGDFTTTYGFIGAGRQLNLKFSRTALTNVVSASQHSTFRIMQFTSLTVTKTKSISHPTISSPGYSEKSLVLLTYVSASKTFN